MSTTESRVREIFREEMAKLRTSPRSGIVLPAGWVAREVERATEAEHEPALVEIARSPDGKRIIETTLRRSKRRRRSR